MSDVFCELLHTSYFVRLLHSCIAPSEKMLRMMIWLRANSAIEDCCLELVVLCVVYVVGLCKGCAWPMAVSCVWVPCLLCHSRRCDASAVIPAQACATGCYPRQKAGARSPRAMLCVAIV